MSKNQINRILIKISGESIKLKDNNIFNLNYIKNLAKQNAILVKKYQIGIVSGEVIFEVEIWLLEMCLKKQMLTIWECCLQ